MNWFLRLGLLAAAIAATPSTHRAAELVVLRPETWDEYAPLGKEVDCIFGDFVLRNDKLVAVVAQPIAGRNANMTIRNVGGAIIDLTRVDHSNDQLGAFYPGGPEIAWRSVGFAAGDSAQTLKADTSPSEERPVIRALAIALTCHAEDAADRPATEVRYTLADGWEYVLVETTITNRSDQPLKLEPMDSLRADGSFERSPADFDDSFCIYDKWFDQAYGLKLTPSQFRFTADPKSLAVRYHKGDEGALTIVPGASLVVSRRMFAAASLLELRTLMRFPSGSGGPGKGLVTLNVRDTAGHALAGAELSAECSGARQVLGRTDAQGQLIFDPSPRLTNVRVWALGCGEVEVADLGKDVTVELPEPGYIVAKISDEGEGPIPCKVQFRGRGEVPDPDFGHQTGEWGVKNVRYSENGRFRQPIGPGKYEVIISHGPEHDAVFTEVEVARGQDSPLEAKLVRSVQTPGWISADFHGHSSPSGDNTSSQLGRVLNLLCEHIEFAPCTEHNRLSTYEPHLVRIGARHLMATCTGIELTDQPGDVNHHNAFPLIREPHTQDDGAPESDADMELKVERLALWDGGSEKLIQQNHPDIGHVFFDKDGDGTPDSGFAKAFPFMDVIEVHPPHFIFQPPVITSGGKTRNNTVFNWLQLLNHPVEGCRRLPGIVNTDAHYNFHGSGFLRIYLASPTDDPARVDTLDMVHAAEHGHVIMTSGPYLEVQFAAGQEGEHVSGTAGNDLVAPSGQVTMRVRVQCPNWFDIDRVQVFLNGRPDEKLNFARTTTPNLFTGGVVKFDQAFSLELAGDTHVIVVAAGEHSTLGPVMGPDHAADMPIAISNPIFVDVDGGGFTPNGDTLGSPLPVMAGKASN